MNLITIIAGIIAFFLMRSQKSSVTEGQIDESPLNGSLFLYVSILCFLSPVVSQAIFYYGWRTQLPEKAKKANRIGWIVLLFWVLVWVIGII